MKKIKIEILLNHLNTFKDLLRKYLNIFIDFAIYAFYSSCGTAADLITLLILVHFGISPGISNSISYTIGVLVSYWLCFKKVFSVDDYPIARGVVSLFSHLLSLLIQYEILVVVSDLVDIRLMKFILLGLDGILMLVVNVYIVYSPNMGKWIQYLKGVQQYRLIQYFKKYF